MILIAASEAKHFATLEKYVIRGSPASQSASALYTSRRAASSCIAMSASMNDTPWNSETAFPN